MHSVVRSYFFLLLFAGSLTAQVNIEGLLTIEYQQGQANSQFTVNGVRNSNSAFFINNIQLFADKEFSEHVSASAVIDVSLYNSTRVYQLRVYQASVTFNDLFHQGVNAEIGKVISSFGKTSQKILALYNPLIGIPLIHQYYSPLSRLRGYLPVAPDQRAEDDLGLPVVSQIPYFNGGKLFGTLFSDFLEYDLGVFNQSLSNYWSEIDLNKNYSFAGRIGIQPAIWLNTGVSYHHGAYLDRNTSVNNVIDVNKYKQTSFGADMNVNIYYYDLSIEYIANKWIAPYIKKDAVSGKEVLFADNLNLANRALSASLKVDVPQLPGLYLAARHDRLDYDEITNPDNVSQSIEWNYGVRKTELGAGYKIANGLTAKISYQFTRRTGYTLKKFDALLAQLSIRL